MGGVVSEVAETESLLRLLNDEGRIGSRVLGNLSFLFSQK